MTMRILFFILFIFNQIEVFAQTSYDVFLLGEYDYSVSLDTCLHWYVSNVNQNDKKETVRQFVAIDVQKDLICKFDTDRYYVSIDTSLHLEGRILIGTSDTLSTFAYKEYDEPFILPLGESVEIYQQYFRDCSPFVNLLVSGEVEQNGWYTTMKNYQLTVGCFFTVYAYHKRYQEENYQSFTQDINELIRPVLKYKKINSACLFMKAYIDQDEYYDMLLYVNGTFILLLSENYDFRKKKLYHIEKYFEDRRSMDF